MSNPKECFVISPIGSEGSETREHANKLLKYIIREALEDYEYNVIRSDEMSEPGSITSQVIRKVVDSDLVIADLTDHNPNVFYELAIRHATGDPYIQLINTSQNIPFDISDLRTIKYNFDVSVAEQAVEEIQNQIDLIESDDPEFDSPVSKSAKLKSWEESEDPDSQSFAELVGFMEHLSSKLDRLENKVGDRPNSLKRDVYITEEKSDGEHRDLSDATLKHIRKNIESDQSVNNATIYGSLSEEEKENEK
ncbi:hypothetical protein [Halorubrum halophilum]|uniref:hypothetical protein n=1 Tax=Halorubrum halophilum TaxID=413816 RepID=UPI0012AB82CD|nr:hypothetical protein [Halorubrum halophilum]